MNTTCQYNPDCNCAKCAALRVAVENADCDFGSCGDCPRCRAEEAAEAAHYQSEEFQAEIDAALACDGSARCDCDRCDSERELAADAELRAFSSKGRDEQDEATYRWWLCENRGI